MHSPVSHDAPEHPYPQMLATDTDGALLRRRLRASSRARPQPDLSRDSDGGAREAEAKIRLAVTAQRHLVAAHKVALEGVRDRATARDQS